MARGFLDDQPSKSDLVDVLDVRLVHETDKALLVETETAGKVWVPKSRCEFESAYLCNHEKYGTLTLPKSLAEEKGLV
jgi:hypothetical protein